MRRKHQMTGSKHNKMHDCAIGNWSQVKARQGLLQTPLELLQDPLELLQAPGLQSVSIALVCFILKMDNGHPGRY